MHMKTFITSVLALLISVAAMGYATGASGSTPEGGDPSPVYVETTQILYLESYPVQVQLLVTGNLPTPCHEVAYEVQDRGEAIDVLLWSLADPELMCVAVLEPFESVIPLGSFERADLPVLLNGEEVGRIEVSSGATGPSLEGAGWSFGFCLGYCRADLAIEGNDLILTGGDREGQNPLYINRGALTPAGRARLETALAALSGVSLDPVYGCPDCADGGASYVELGRDGPTERIEMEFGAPPDELAELYRISASLIGDLEACRSNEYVSAAADCVAYQPD